MHVQGSNPDTVWCADGDPTAAFAVHHPNQNPGARMNTTPRYDVKDVCTNCWHDSCDNCRGGDCACRKFNHPPGHSYTFIDSEGEERCECGKWLEPGYYEIEDHLRSVTPAENGDNE
ncbi:hypothetical protein I5H56_gp096 [Mycobacterium phage KristaRAM]|uniref:Uncharacterized protein n=1 Tax=Mycobacterium phage KristaRAM TaxID=2301700 RepID=A0A385DXC7_9CAUD|nr:hypothetical protein I5H56_gp096 [Mycobacterium phage KristaRAM]AXQ64153.1 hypothetical protein SEA_KRISTARAM_96 [Mycobacterium phage KristaRAM]